MAIKTLCTTIFASLIGATNVYSGSPVQSVNLKLDSNTSAFQPRITVANNGSSYTRIVTGLVTIPISFSASCSNDTQLRKVYIGLGKFNILSGQMDETQKIFFEKISSASKTHTIPWRKYTFRFNANRIPFGGSTTPVSACNAFLKKKLSQGMSRQSFLQQDRKMKVVFQISFAAECIRKWKHSGLWKQVTKTASAVVSCKGR